MRSCVTQRAIIFQLFEIRFFFIWFGSLCQPPYCNDMGCTDTSTSTEDLSASQESNITTIWNAHNSELIKTKRYNCRVYITDLIGSTWFYWCLAFSFRRDPLTTMPFEKKWKLSVTWSQSLQRDNISSFSRYSSGLGRHNLKGQYRI